MRTMPLPVSLAELFHLVRTEVKGADLTSWHSLLANSDMGISGPPPRQQKDKLRLLGRRLCCARPHGTGPCSRQQTGEHRSVEHNVMPSRCPEMIPCRKAHDSPTCRPEAAASGRECDLPARW